MSAGDIMEEPVPPNIPEKEDPVPCTRYNNHPAQCEIRSDGNRDYRRNTAEKNGKFCNYRKANGVCAADTKPTDIEKKKRIKYSELLDENAALRKTNAALRKTNTELEMMIDR